MMRKMSIFAIRDVELAVSDISRTSTFYADTWGLQKLEPDGDSDIFRATGVEHHVLVLRPRAQPGLLSIGLAASTAEEVDAIYQSLLTQRQTVLNAPHELPTSLGGGYGLEIATPLGIKVRVSANVSKHSNLIKDSSRPKKLSHVVINIPDRATHTRWFIEQLGFKLSDTTRTQTFLRCGTDHHSIAFGDSKRPSINHIAYEMEDIDGVMFGTGRMMDHGYESEWGLGRHGPGSNVFNYFIDPEGIAIEYTAELDQITDQATEPGEPEYWSGFPRRPCRWGVARQPSERLRSAFSGESSSVILATSRSTDGA